MLPRPFQISHAPFRQCVGALRRADERADYADRINDARDGPLIRYEC
jgi:hypothetical protein